MSNLVPLMLVPLIVWVAVWAYLYTLDGKVKRLEALAAKGDSGTEEDR